MKKIILIILTLLFCISVYPADIPILFLHGHKKQAQPWEEENEVNAGGWGTWNPQNTDHTREHSSSMTDILDIKYGGYIAGTPLNCDKDSILTSTNGNTKVIYNFSFYRPDGGMGVIGSNGQLKCDYIVTELNYVVKKEHTDAASWEYGYDYSDDPVHNPYPLLGDSWAKNFTRFIDKVLIATGANEVDVVTHSMGALVVRAAMKYYGCKDKIRKILTIAAPNHYFDSWLPESIWGAFSGDPYWMRNGEDWELSADNRSGIFNITFTDKNTGASQPFTEFLDVYPKGGIATIAGNKGWALIYDNDHVIGVYQVELDNAEFNAVVYQQHSYGSKISKEYCITMSTYTTEYIKSWIIDDVIRDGYTKICEPFVYDINGIEWGNRFYWKDGCLRVRSSAYPHDTSLVTLVRLVKDIFKKDAMDETKSIQTVLAVKAFPIYQYPMAFPGDPVFLVEKGKMPEFGYEYLIEITDMDMTGEKNNRKEVLHFEDGVSSYISLSNISTSCFVGDNINLSWNSNDKFNHQKLLYNINEGVWHTITSLTSDIRNYTFKTTQRGEHKFRIYGFLDVNTPINDISNICNVKSEYSLGFTAEYISVGPYVKLYYFPYGKNVDATPEEDPNYYYDIYKDGIKIVRTNYRSYDYYEYIPKGEQREYFVKYYRKYTNEYMGRSGTRTVFGGDNSGCPYFYIKENGEYIPQNTIMYYGNSNMRDFFLFNYDNKNNQENIKKANNIKVNNFIEAAISENEIETDYIDRIILKAIKYDSDYNLTINKDGQYLFWREREKIDSCINNEGDNIFSLLEYLDGNIYEAYPGDTIYIYRNTDNNQDAISPVISGI
ncbi:hypothetical protein KAU15_06430, partial [candidate division WOR-3 bacterium]|nr:hypothetical protein [candidate division WOR-3 bacterium]